jgi:hypothetical protein
MLALKKMRWLPLVMLPAPSVLAGVEEIRAVFRPDPANPMANQFRNVTPSTGYCAHFAYYCDPRGWFTLNMPLGGPPQTVGGPVEANHADPRSSPRTITVRGVTSARCIWSSMPSPRAFKDMP